MYSLTIVFGQNHSVVWTLMFRDQVNAEKAAEELSPSDIDALINITDDFGQSVKIKNDQVVALMVEDMTKSKLAHIERALNHAHMQADMQRAAESDPKLRIARNMQGPSMISPIGPNGRM